MTAVVLTVEYLHYLNICYVRPNQKSTKPSRNVFGVQFALNYADVIKEGKGLKPHQQ